ncbi:MAG: TonB-dependent receptor [Sphingomonas sp.]|uniref:TonB-dependent receptor domain-containing protein n=1 Tax=Sphingomonas sp. TaxID=28214 RepID=UPI00185975AE|nr:TonB-dependent receptor [Sphingomonas sp.]MBA3666755.1 TonB-dependent receptor [Sphingomonas sp.]
MRCSWLSGPIGVLAFGWSVQANAQATANATTGAEDAFGFSVGDESVGIYGAASVRGFDLEAAGNYRFNGTYFVKNSGVSNFFIDSTTIRIGFNTLRSVLPGPLGVVDYRLRDPAHGEPSLLTIERDADGAFHADLHFKHRRADERASYSLGVGLVANLSNEQGGDGGRSLLIAGATRQTLGAATVRLFGGEYQYRRPGRFRVVPGPGALPPAIERGRDLGQRWSVEKGQRRIAGVLMDVGEEAALGGGLTLVFSQEDPTRTFRQFFDDVRSDGTAHATIVGLPQQRSTSWSGEARGHRQWTGRAITQRIDLMLRGRRSRARLGGAVSVDLGRMPFGEQPSAVPAPDLTASQAQVHDGVDQWGAGVSYRAVILDRVTVNGGLLLTDYRKSFATARGARGRTSARPLLYNVAVSWRAVPGLDLYAAYSRGLEEAGVAPINAINRNAVLDAITATQREIGLRYRIRDGLMVSLGGFDTRKPYIGLDARSGIYGSLGGVRHRGIELSLSGKIARGFSIVVGGVYLDPKIDGPLVRTGQIGDRPVGVPRLRAVANVDYALPGIPGLSVDAGVTHVSSRPARSILDATGAQLSVPAIITLDAGLRYRFSTAGMPLTLRAQLLNVTGRFAWDVDSSETIAYIPGRQFRLALTSEL